MIGGLTLSRNGFIVVAANGKGEKTMRQDIKLTASERAVAYAASTDGERLSLSTLHFGNGEIAAADGWVLAVKKIDGIGDGVNVMLPASAILQAKDIGKQLPNVLVELPDAEGEKATITMKDFAKLSVEPIQGTFPDYKQLFPTKEVAATVSLDPKKLKQMLAIAGKDTTMIKLEVYDSESPVKFTCHGSDDHDTIGLIMPMMNNR